MSYQFTIAWRYLRARRSQKVLSVISLIAVLGITVGVWALVSVLAFQTGMEQELRNKILGGTAHMNVLRRKNLPLESPRELIEKIKRIPHVKTAAATTYQTVLLTGVETSAMGILKAVDLEAPPDANEVYQTLLPGGDVRRLARTTYEDGTEIEGIILGKKLAEELNVRLGETMQAVTTEGGQLTPAGMLPRTLSFKVVGFFEAGLYEYDSSWCYVSMETARQVSGEAEPARVIQITLDNVFTVKEVGQAIRAQVGPDYLVNDWQELNQPAFAALNLQRLGFAVGISLIILVAALNIITTLIMLVVEKKRDIAILMAMGATSRDILLIFMVQGLVIGIFGTVIGGVLGAGTAWLGETYKLVQLDPRTYSISYVPFHISAGDTLLVLLITLGISFLATLYPAWRAAQLDPVEGIRQG
ncbi:MAG: ABC transporter permease [Blastocatellia bacterium]|nr:ABC transporter permease [Blastocatellia bacterium]